ncbi:MAG: glycosyltransferase family 39 protein [Anaerolineae bacterium]|nr:glycosyltransferase family 39 protein [Anaerolineae bacterium]
MFWFALLILPVGYLFLWPLTDRLLKDRGKPPLQVALTALAFSVGVLGLLLFYLGLLPGTWLSGVSALAIIVIGLVVGLVLNPGWVSPRRWLDWWRSQWRRLVRLDLEALLSLAIIGAVTVILVYLLYYPFIGDDTLVRYALQARLIYLARSLPGKVWGYPPLVPITFATTWFAAGSVNEHLAKIFQFVMVVGTLGATYLIAGRKGNRRRGLLAAAIVALTPMFVNYGSLAYTDIATTFPLTLALLSMIQWWESEKTFDVLLAGLLLGVALFVKQSGVSWLASASLIPVLKLIASRRQPVPGRWRKLFVALACILLPAILIAGPWYLRNVLIGGWEYVMPVAGLYHQLSQQAGLLGISPSLAYPDAFGYVLTPLYTIGWMMGIYLAVVQGIKVLRADDQPTPVDLILAAAAIPYWLAWWMKVSHNPRFMLLALPLLATWSVYPVEWIAGWIQKQPWSQKIPQIVWQGIGVVVLLGTAFLGTQERLGGVYYTITKPFATDDQRLEHAKSLVYELVHFARTELDPETDRLYLMDDRLAYYLTDFETFTGNPSALAELEDYDYIFYNVFLYDREKADRIGWQDREFYVHAFDDDYFEPVFETHGIHVMRILHPEQSGEGS